MRYKVILLKEKDIEKGLTISEYIDWCAYFNKTKIVNVRSSKDCIKKEILDYSEDLNKNHHRLMNNKEYKSENSKMLRCWNCNFVKNISNGSITCGGTQTYVITCKKEFTCFEVNFNAHNCELPCHGK
jgi:hypothetical protein